MYNKPMKRLHCSFAGLVVFYFLAAIAAKTPEKYGIFGEDYYEAQQILSEMTLDERIAQTIIAEYQGSESVAEMQQYQFGGYIFFANSFRGKDSASVQAMISRLQSVAKLPLLTAVDEEGGIVTR
ncbi:MAG: hypothetical protein K2J10_07720, partial [Muribaculaceae bacterium]|nr:hypothetical protein [Muribaculaceae bacterium]